MDREIDLFIRDYLNEVREENAAIIAGAGLPAAAGFMNWRDLLRPIGADPSRVLELTYTPRNISSWAKYIGFEGESFSYNSECCALLRTQLESYFVKLYELAREKLLFFCMINQLSKDIHLKHIQNCGETKNVNLENTPLNS